LGKVNFPTSCTPQAQVLFDRALAYQHSFWYRESHAGFQRALAADPNCAIAYWGIGQALLFNPFVTTPQKNLADGLAAIEKGRALPAKTERERDYVDTIHAYYRDHDKLDQATRVRAYLTASEKLAQKYPKDDEAQIYYALALGVAASPNDKTYANQLKAAACLEPISKRRPQHPGVAHYLIHVYDYPAIAQRGLPAAQRYAKIAPAAPHAQHMPSHIFTRVGYWQQSVVSNSASAKSAKAQNEAQDQLHAMDYLVYAHLQMAQDKAARAVLDEAPNVTGNVAGFAAAYALAAMPARYAIERADWSAAAALTVRPSGFAQVDAISHFARALGAARTGKPEAAKADIGRLGELSEKLRQEKVLYWAEQVDIQKQVAQAWVLLAEGKRGEALTAMRAAADAEDRTEKHAVTPGPLAPARELLGDMLLATGNAKDALAAFESTLKKEPNRFNAHAGAAKAAMQAANPVAARRHYRQMAQIAANADTMRPDLAAARADIAVKR